MDDPILHASAEEESGTFFKDNPPPVFVDEIQKAPALFEQIKLFLDRERKKGQFFLCGSQQFRMMKGVSESLAECSCTVRKHNKQNRYRQPPALFQIM